VGTFQEGATFEVPVYIDTKGKSINTIELHLKFDQRKLQVISPAGRSSVITLWVEAPSYSNTNGTINFVGVVPGGINTTNGLVATITFKALALGDARISIASNSQILANDGQGTSVQTDFGSALFTIQPLPPDGVTVYSETHPQQDTWYNNDTPILTWEKPDGVTAYSYILDDKPNTIPDNTQDTTDTKLSFPNLKEGISYFHLKSQKAGLWGGTTHFTIRIDTAPPAAFKPTAEMYAAAITSSKAIVSFFTTDTLSGVDHYEVGTINKNDSADISPAFLEAQSPYTVPTQSSKEVRVIVRAFDKAGNVRDEYIDISLFPTFAGLLQRYSLDIILTLLLLIILLLVSRHYLFKHHVLRHLKRAFGAMKEEDMPMPVPPPPAALPPPTGLPTRPMVTQSGLPPIQYKRPSETGTSNENR